MQGAFVTLMLHSHDQPEGIHPPIKITFFPIWSTPGDLSTIRRRLTRGIFDKMRSRNHSPALEKFGFFVNSSLHSGRDQRTRCGIFG